MNTVAVPPISKGLDLPISGAPDQRVNDGPAITSVAIVADDYIGMKPTMLVSEGDRVKLGQVLFEDKKTAGVKFTAPAAGTVVAVNRGAKRKFESLVIEIEGDSAETFSTYPDVNLHSLDRDQAKQNLLASGLWTALRTRPYNKVPAPDSVPHSLFVTAIDTHPLAPDPAVVLQQPDYERYFTQGLQLLMTLTDGTLYLCKAPDVSLPGEELEGLAVAEFAGPHPAGLAGTHIHFLDPVNETKTVWHIGYQDVVAIGNLFLNGTLMNDRVISVAGPAVKQPHVVRTQLGASISELTKGNLTEQTARVISGSVLSGRSSAPPKDYLGRFHNQVSAIRDGSQREFLGWAMPGFKKFSVTNAFASSLGKQIGRLPFSTSTQGSKRAIVPIGVYEKVMPLDIIATPLLKSLLVQDTETAQMLGCLELDEEDLALCTFVCPGKNEYGPLLRQCLTLIEREG